MPVPVAHSSVTTSSSSWSDVDASSFLDGDMMRLSSSSRSYWTREDAWAQGEDSTISSSDFVDPVLQFGCYLKKLGIYKSNSVEHISGGVFRVQRVDEAHNIAVKFVNCHRSERNELDMARLCAAASPKYIVNCVRSLSLYDSVSLIEMEYIEGCDLFALVQSPERYVSKQPSDVLALPDWLVEHALRSVVHALYACHSVGVAHRDIKLENIVVETHGQFIDAPNTNLCIKLADFGLARHQHTWSEAKFSGTPGYYAPEMIGADIGTLDLFKTDIWSLGLTLFCMMTGTCLFHYKDPNYCSFFHELKQEDIDLRILNQICKRMPTPSHYARYEPLTNLLLRMTKLRPEERCTINSIFATLP